MLESWQVCEFSQHIWYVRHVAEHVQFYTFSRAIIMGFCMLNVMAGMTYSSGVISYYEKLLESEQLSILNSGRAVETI